MRLRNIAFAFATTLFMNGLPARPQAPAPHSAPATPSHADPAQPVHPANTDHGEEAAGHHGPEIKLFGFSLGQLGQFLVRLANFGIFFAILFFVLKSALSSAFKDRAKELQDQLAQAEKDKTEGEAQLQELEAKMADMQKELAGIMTKAEMDAEAEKQRILEAARAEADQILEQTRSEIEFQQRLAEKALRALVAELAIEEASKRLETRVQGTTAKKVLDRAIEAVGGSK